MVLGIRVTSLRRIILVVLCCLVVLMLIITTPVKETLKDIFMSAVRTTGPAFRGSCLPRGDIPSNISIGVLSFNGVKDELYEVRKLICLPYLVWSLVLSNVDGAVPLCTSPPTTPHIAICMVCFVSLFTGVKPLCVNIKVRRNLLIRLALVIPVNNYSHLHDCPPRGGGGGGGGGGTPHRRLYSHLQLGIKRSR